MGLPYRPYSPELNPQESVWKEIKPEGFYNRGFETMDSVENQLVSVLKQFEQQAERLKKLTAWQWILNALQVLKKVQPHTLLTI